MRVLWYWPHPHRVLSPAAEPLVRAGDHLTIQCLARFQDGSDDPRVEFRRELPVVRRFQAVPRPLRRLLRIETYVRRAVMRERLVRRGRFDVCHIATPNYLTDALTMPRLRRMLAVVAVVHDVVPHESRMPTPIERFLLRRVYRSADVYVVLHEVVARRLVVDFGVDPSRVVIAAHPTDPAIPSPLGDGDAVARSRCDGPTNFLFFGTFRRDKGIPVLLDAARRLAGDSNVRVRVAGSGDDGLERMVRVAAERGDVDAEIGRISDTRKDALFREADVVVLPYSDPERFQSQSGVLADAYAYRRPIVASDVGAIGPTVHADATGWVVPAGDAVALAEQMRRVAADGASRRAAEVAIESVLPRYSYDEYGRTLRHAYELAIRSR